MRVFFTKTITNHYYSFSSFGLITLENFLTRKVYFIYIQTLKYCRAQIIVQFARMSHILNWNKQLDVLIKKSTFN